MDSAIRQQSANDNKEPSFEGIAAELELFTKNDDIDLEEDKWSLKLKIFPSHNYVI